MPRGEPLQTSFAAGELSPRMRGRVDLPIHAAGVALAENFQPLPQGPLLMRGPLELVAESNFAAPIRLIPFRAAGLPDFILALGDLKLQIFSPGGRVVFGGANLVVNGDFAQQLTGWVSYRATATNGYAKLTMGRVFDPDAKVYEEDPGRISQQITISAAGDYVLTFEAGGTGGLQAKIGSTVVTHGQVVTLAPGVYTLSFTVGGVYQDYATIDNVLIEAASSDYDIVTPWSGLQIAQVQYVSETGKDRMVLVHPNVEPRVLTRNADGTWTFAAPAWTNKPATWVGTNWPGAIEIHKGRSWWAGTPDDRNKVWASCARGNLFDFTVAVAPVASDSIAMDMATRGAVQWFRGRRNLLVGTDEGEHAFLAQNGIISPSDIESNDESDHGSAPVQAVRAGNRVLYVSPDRRQVRAIAFDLQQESWTTKDLTWAAEHISVGGIDELHFAKDPIPTLVAVVSEELRLATLHEGGDAAGWWRVTTAGQVLSAATSNGPGGSSIWIAVQRAGGLFIEQLRLAEVGARYTLDSARTVYADANGLLTTLGHLNGETVQVIVDEVLVLDAVVVAGGQIALGPDYAGAKAVIGLPAPAKKAVLLPRNPKSGKVRNSLVGVHLNDSAIPKVAGWRARERDASTPWDRPTERRSGKVEVRAGKGWDEDGEIVIEQDLPFRTEILGVYSVTTREA